MRVLKHSEQSSGCPLNCNGPFPNAWSKTMMGYGEEYESFAFEIAFNYGINNYRMGNNFRGAFVSEGDIPLRALHNGYKMNQDLNGQKFLVDPDGYKFFLVPDGKKGNICHISLSTCDLTSAKEFYTKIAGLKVLQNDHRRLLLGTSDSGTKLEIVKIFTEIDHGETSVRLAISTPNLDQTRDLVISHGEGILFDKQKLGNIHVLIVKDRDGYEVCFADKEEYFQSNEPQEGDAIIHWEKRQIEMSEQIVNKL